MDIELKEDYVVELEDVDFWGHMKLFGIARHMQNIAVHHAGLIGKGFFQDETKPSYYWVVSRVKYILNKNFNWKERFSIKTYIAGYKQLFAVRFSDIINEENEMLGQAITNYILVDTDKGRPLRITAKAINEEVIEEYVGESLEKLSLPSTIIAEEERKARYSELDSNGHMNNLQYIRWILDMLPLEFYKKQEVETLQINYNKPIMYKDKIKVILGTVKEAGYRIAGVSLDGKINYFTAHLTFRNCN